MSRNAWVTLATNDSYAMGALVLSRSLKGHPVNTQHQLAILVTDGVSDAMKDTLRGSFDLVEVVNALESNDESRLALTKRPELGITFTKLLCWKLLQFDKCVFLDADMLILKNCDELFEYDELSAAPDVGWPDCFNSGLFVFKPSNDTYSKLISFASEHGSFDGGDQGLLNSFFSDWRTNALRRIPFTYNTSISTAYSYLPAFKMFENDIKVIHFLGPYKPWNVEFNFATRRITKLAPHYHHLGNYFSYWWDLFCESVHPQLKQEMAGLAGQFARAELGSAKGPCIEAWQKGEIDYMGVDSFSNILSKIEATLEKKPLTVADLTPSIPTETAPVAAPSMPAATAPVPAPSMPAATAPVAAPSMPAATAPVPAPSTTESQTTAAAAKSEPPKAQKAPPPPKPAVRKNKK